MYLGFGSQQTIDRLSWWKSPFFLLFFFSLPKCHESNSSGRRGGGGAWFVCSLGCLSQQHAKWILGTDLWGQFTLCCIEAQAAHQIYLIQSQYAVPDPASPGADPKTQDVWQGSHKNTQLSVDNKSRQGYEARASCTRSRRLILLPLFFFAFLGEGRGGESECVCVCARARVCVCVCGFACMCVLEREREREREMVGHGRGKGKSVAARESMPISSVSQSLSDCPRMEVWRCQIWELSNILGRCGESNSWLQPRVVRSCSLTVPRPSRNQLDPLNVSHTCQSLCVYSMVST